MSHEGILLCLPLQWERDEERGGVALGMQSVSSRAFPVGARQGGGTKDKWPSGMRATYEECSVASSAWRRNTGESMLRLGCAGKLC